MYAGQTHLMFDDKLLRHTIKVTLTHLLEPISNLLLDQFIRFIRVRQSGESTVLMHGRRLSG